MDIHEVVRLLRDGASDREVAQLVGLNRRTVARYRGWADEQGVLVGPLPSCQQLEQVLWRCPAPGAEVRWLQE
jgi:transposase